MASGCQLEDNQNTGLPPGFQLEPNQVAVQPSVAPAQDPSVLPSGFVLEEDKYGSVPQQGIAALEGVARGVLGPVAPAIETAMGVDPEGIRRREEQNPVTHGVTEAAGLLGSLAIPGGQARVLTKAGEVAQGIAGLAKVAEGASVAHKVGSVAVAQAAEMAVYQGGDEIAKFILKDPDQTAETAVANIGLATVLGGGVGAGVGSISPLWKATVGPKFEKALTGFREHLDGGGKLKLPEEIEAAQKALGIEISPATRAGMSGDPKARQIFNELREAQSPEILADIKKLQDASSEQVAKSLGIGPEDVLSYNEADIGHNLKNTFLKEYKAKYGPVSEQMAQREAMAERIAISDDARLKLYGDMLEQGINEVGTDSPFYKLYHDYGNRILAKDTIGGLDKLSTEIRRSASTLGKDNNEKQVLNHINSMLKNFKDEQILAEGAVKGLDTLAERAAANQGYKQFAEMSDKLMSHLGVGDFRGYKGLVEKLNEAGAESLLRKFSTKGDADLIPFLLNNFPETFQAVRDNELKKLLKPAVIAAKGDNAINVKKLSDIVKKGMAGEKAYIESLLSPEALQKIQAAESLLSALPEMKSSGTAGWMTKMYKQMPASAMAAVGWLTGHNPLVGYLTGMGAQWLGRELPDAAKLAFLKFIASEQPVNAAGFKAMANVMKAAYKGEKLMKNASNNLFKPTVRVLSDAQMPTQKQLERIDRMVAEHQNNPNQMFDQQTKDSDVGYYLPAHQVALSKTSSNAVNYLSSLKPKPFKPGPLSKAIEPSAEEKARYDRALQIAQQPILVMQRIKDGTILPSDIMDLKAMYPAMYMKMTQQVTNHMINKQSDDEPIPYKTRLGLSLFLGQPVDASMQPQSIMKAQPIPNPKEPQVQQMQSPKRSTSSLGKNTVKSTMTAVQGAESSRQTRD